MAWGLLSLSLAAPNSLIAVETPEVTVARLPDYRVTTSRTFLSEDVSPLMRVWGIDEITKYNPQTVDDLLSEEPSFSLYRRQSAYYAHPTAQGISLHHLGATAATRTLVLRDGVPQNDPFGGWITWSRYAPAAIETLSILPGSQASSWGNQSAGGTLLIESIDPFSEMHQASLSFSPGGYSTDAQQTFSDAKHGISVNLYRKEQSGFYLTHPDDQGPIDQRAEHENYGGDLRYVFAQSENTRIETAFSYYDEERNNGTPLANNSTEAYDLSVHARGQANIDWDAVLYYQHREFQNQFTSVNAARDSENPVLDQFLIESEGIGGSATLAWDGTGERHYMAGLDMRHNSGDTNEDFSFGLDDRRIAGGDQTITGVFLKVGSEDSSPFQYEATLRFDHWSQQNGRLRETALATDTITKDSDYPDRDDWEPSASIAANYRINEQLHWSVGAGYAFRIPTINELYRPYRVSSDITDANPELKNERFLSVETALKWTPNEKVRAETGLYHYWIRDAIANVYQFSGPGSSPGGFVPASGTYNQRQNVDEASVFGWQTRAEYRPLKNTILELNYLYTRAEFDRSPIQPTLEGKRFPQVAEHQASVHIRQQLSESISVWASAEYNAAQHEDALNTILLPAYTVAQVGLNFRIKPSALVSLRVDNLTDETILTGESSSGIRTVAPPRTFWLTTRFSW